MIVCCVVGAVAVAAAGKLIKLQQLKANGNKISEIPEEIGKCKSVKVMHLNENIIIGIPPTLAECTRLEVLRLQVRGR